MATGEGLDIRWSDNNTRQRATHQSVGTSISARGNATLDAGRDINAQAAKLGAGDTLTLDAKGNVTLEAAIDQQGAQTYQKSGGGMSYFSLDAKSSEQSLNRTELSAKDVAIKSGGDTTLSATTVNAETLEIDAGGKLALLAPKTQDSQQWDVTHGSSASVGRQWESFAKEMNQCQAKASGCSPAEQSTIRERYQQLSAEQNAALANCDKTGNCAQLREEVMSGTSSMLNLIDRLPIGGASGNDLGQLAGQQLANDPAYRARVNESIEVISQCNANPAACNQQALNAASLVIAPLLPAAGVSLTAGRLIIGGSIGALGNAGGQLYANGGNLSDLKLTDAAVGAFTGALTYGAGFWSSLAVNSGGALVTSSLNGADANSTQGAILGAAAGTTVGYPLGMAVERGMAGYFNHWSRPQWQDLGLTIQKWIGPSPWPGAGGMQWVALLRRRQTRRSTSLRQLTDLQGVENECIEEDSFEDFGSSFLRMVLHPSSWISINRPAFHPCDQMDGPPRRT